MPGGPIDTIRAWARRQGVELTPTQIDQLARFLDTLLLWNRRVSLVSQRDPRLIASKHFADSLAAAAWCAAGERVIDLGSGAGFPGLVIAIVRPAAQVTLIESRQKKASFLLEVLRAAAVTNARVVAERIEAAGRRAEHQAQYTLATARALTGVSALLTLARPLLAPGGRALLMKGRGYREDLAACDPAALGFTLADTIRYALPDGVERVLLVFRLL